MLLAAGAAACTNQQAHHHPPEVLDAPRADAYEDIECFCNVLTQTGCPAGQKCQWGIDQTTPTPLGHITCAPDGTVPVGGACSYGPIIVTPDPGSCVSASFDNCVRGSQCWSGTCEAICDPQGGSPTCSAGYACVTHEGLFGPNGQPVAAGLCEPICDPLADNDLLGSGSRAGSSCAAGSGCYGYPSSQGTSLWHCMPELEPALVHRSPCTTADGCANSTGNPFLNGCAQGYIPLLYDAFGSMQVDCIAVCKPGNTYAGNPGTQYPAGQTPHTCSTGDARGTFDPATTTNNGDACMYSWLFEIDPQGTFHRSPTSDTVGFCVNHSKYRYDSNGDGVIDSSDAVWPLCASLADGSAAAQFGCVDTMHAGYSFGGKTSLERLPVRLPYPADVRPAGRP